MFGPRRKLNQGVAQSPMPIQVSCVVPVESSLVDEASMKYKKSDESNLGKARVGMDVAITERDDDVFCLGGDPHTISCKCEWFKKWRHTRTVQRENSRN